MPSANSLGTSLGNGLSRCSGADEMSVSAKRRGVAKYSVPNRWIYCGRYGPTMGYPCGKRMYPMLTERVEGWEKWHGALSEPFPALSAATLDRELSALHAPQGNAEGGLDRSLPSQKEHPQRRSQQATHSTGTSRGRHCGSLQRRHVRGLRVETDGNG